MDSMYQLIVVAAQRNKQLVRGAAPRIRLGPLTHRSTTIALEETRRGLVPFTMNGPGDKNGDAGDALSGPVVSTIGAAGVQSHKEMP